TADVEGRARPQLRDSLHGRSVAALSADEWRRIPASGNLDRRVLRNHGAGQRRARTVLSIAHAAVKDAGLLLSTGHGRLRALIMRRSAVVALLALSCAGGLLAQRFRGRGGGGEGSIPEDSPIHTAREVPTHSTEFPRWTNAPGFEKDVFTFARIRYKRHPYGTRSRTAGYCFIDFPDSDLN